jgi:hypothetical protein
MILLLGVSLYTQLMTSHQILNLYKVEIVMTDRESESCVHGDFIAFFNIFRTVFLMPKYVMIPMLSIISGLTLGATHMTVRHLPLGM